MSVELVTILVLALIFVLATVFPINIGALALVAAFFVGTIALDLDPAEEIATGFPGDLAITLIGVTYLFAIARNNGTVDLIVRASVRAVGGRIAVIPWVIFGVTAVITAIGALSPAAVAIVAPVALGLAYQYGINPLLMGMMVVHGAQGGGFSPISVYGTTVNTIVDGTDLESSPTTLFLCSLIFNAAIAVVLFTVLGGRELMRRHVDADSPEHGADEVAPSGGAATATKRRAATDERTDTDQDTEVTVHQWATLIGLLTLAVLATAFEIDVGFLALTIAVVLVLMAPEQQKGAVQQIAWSTVLLVCGMLTYVFVLEEAGTIDYVGEGVADISPALLAALLLCYVGGVVSAFASSTAILGAIIPLAVPFLQAGEVGAVGMIAALAVSSTIVDVSPFSTNGALVLANAPEEVDKTVFYKQILGYGAIVVAVGPLLAWATMVAPGWL